MRMLRWLWCWAMHERISGVCLPCAGLRPISGGQDFAELADSAIGSSGGGGPTVDFADPYAGGFAPTDTAGPAGGMPSPYPSAGGGGGGGGPDSGPGGFWASLKSGFGDFASGLGKEIAGSPLKTLATGLGLGSTALGIGTQLSAQKQLGQQTKVLQSSEKQAQAAAAPAVDFGTKTLNAAATGELTPALQAKIDEWTQKAKADAASRFAAMGLGNSTQLDSFNRLIDEQAMSMRGSMLQQQEETGLAGLQTGVSAATGVMGASQAQQKSLEELIAQANASIGKLSGSAA